MLYLQPKTDLNLAETQSQAGNCLPPHSARPPMNNFKEEIEIDKLTLKQEKFVEKYIALGNGTQAVIDAGYKAKDRAVAQVIGSENLLKPMIKKAIQAKKSHVAEILEQEAMSLLSNLLEIAYSPTTPVAVRLKALQDLLDRAGYSSKKDISISGGDTAITIETRHTSELAKRARALMTQNIKEEITNV